MSHLLQHGSYLAPARPSRSVPIAILLVMSLSAQLRAEDIEAFAEPFRTVDVAAAEIGLIDRVDVTEGELVQQGQTLAKLTTDVLEASLRIAEKSKNSVGELRAAEADVELKQARLKKLAELLASEHATREEVMRAEKEAHVADARLKAAQEAIEIRSLEYDRTQIQLQRRYVLSPITGVVLKRHREPGEFVSPNEPIVMTVVQLDPLVATFSVPVDQATDLQTGASTTLRFEKTGQSATGLVAFVSPVIEPESQTVLVKVHLPNPEGKYRSGSRLILLPGSKPDQITRRPVR